MEWEEFEPAREDPYQVVLPRKAKRKRFVTSDPYMIDCVVEPDVTGEYLEFKRRWELLEEFLRKRARCKEPARIVAPALRPRPDPALPPSLEL